MKHFNTIFGAVGLAALAGTFTAQAQEIRPEPLVVTPDCAEKVLKEMFDNQPVEIVRTPEGVAASRTTFTPSGTESHVSGVVKLEPSGLVETLNIQVDLTEQGKTPLSASVTLDYATATARINPPLANSILSRAAVDYVSDLEAGLRECVTLTPGPLQP